MSVKFDKVTWESFHQLKHNLEEKKSLEFPVWVDNNKDSRFVCYLGEGG